MKETSYSITDVSKLSEFVKDTLPHGGPFTVLVAAGEKATGKLNGTRSILITGINGGARDDAPPTQEAPPVDNASQADGDPGTDDEDYPQDNLQSGDTDDGEDDDGEDT